MADYIYKISGIDNFNFVIINGKLEKVFHLEFWWKTYVNFFSKKDIHQPRNYHKTVQILHKQFENTQINFVIIPNDIKNVIYDIFNYPIKNFEFTISEHILNSTCCKQIVLDEAV